MHLNVKDKREQFVTLSCGIAMHRRW